MNLCKGTDFYAYYVDGVLCTCTFSSHTERMAFLLYFAVSKMCVAMAAALLLSRISENEKVPLRLVIEPPNDDAADNAQRLARLHFYERNGFFVTSYCLEYGGPPYRILCSSERFDPRDSEDVVQYEFWDRQSRTYSGVLTALCLRHIPPYGLAVLFTHSNLLLIPAHLGLFQLSAHANVPNREKERAYNEQQILCIETKKQKRACSGQGTRKRHATARRLVLF